MVADYGATIDNEVEVFGFIGRASPNPQGYSLLAMVIGLFETGALEAGAGSFFRADTGHFQRSGMSVRLADAFYRGARCGRDLMTIDWFAHSDRPVTEVREELGIVPKSAEAIRAGSSNPWEPAAYTEFQTRGGVAAAISEGREFSPFVRP